MFPPAGGNIFGPGWEPVRVFNKTREKGGRPLFKVGPLSGGKKNGGQKNPKGGRAGKKLRRGTLEVAAPRGGERGALF